MSYVLLPESQDAAARNITTVIYALYALGLFTAGLTAVVAIVINYVKKDDMTGTLYESHFRWQIRTFWFALLWLLLSFPFVLLLLLVWLGVLFVAPAGGLLSLPFFLLLGWGVVALFDTFVLIWYVYRIIKGWLRLTENKPMYESA